MDNKKIGAFIAKERKLQGLTQAEFAHRLYVSEKTVSKWENGRGLPDTGLLIGLCSILKITVNELLSGERLTEADYKERAENNMTDLLLQRKSNKKKILFSSVCALLGGSVLFVCVMLAGFLDMLVWLRICLIIYGFLICLIEIGVAVVYDVNVGSFECSYCGKKFAPTLKAYIFSLHTLTARRLKCPYCGKKGMFKKRMQDKDKSLSE